MAKYRVRYYECYEGYYEVEANSKKKLKRNLSTIYQRVKRMHQKNVMILMLQ